MARLDSERNSWVATVRGDESPHLTPMWFVFLDGSFWLGTGAETVKSANVHERPKVSLSLQDGDDPVVAEGEVVIRDRPFPDEVVGAFMTKYGWDLTRETDVDVGTITLWQVVVDNWLMGGPDA